MMNFLPHMGAKIALNARSSLLGKHFILKNKYQEQHPKGEFQICPRMDFYNILYVEYLRYNNYKNEYILFLEGCLTTRGHLDVHPFCTYI